MAHQRSRTGLPYGVAAYVCWGLFPLYWPLLQPAGALEVLAHRVVWSLVFCVGLLSVARKWSGFGTIIRTPRQLLWLGLASVVIAVNWGSFIWGVNHDHVIDISLGYFINPLVTVLLGVFVLHETLRRAQWAAVVLGTVAVVVLTIEHGRPPWLALIVSGSFAIYAFLKKRANLGAVEALAVETALLFPFALAFLVALQLRGELAFGHHGSGHLILLLGTGVVTAIPLLLFGAAATRLNLSTIGLLQYLGPILQFILGLTVFDEQMSTARWCGFVLVWLALAVFTVDAWRSRRRSLRDAAEGSTAL